MAYPKDVSMQQLTGEIQKRVDDYTGKTLGNLDESAREAVLFAHGIQDMLAQLKGLEDEFTKDKKTLNLHEFEERLLEIQKQGEVYCDDKLSPITADRLPFTDELNSDGLESMTEDDLWNLKNRLRMLVDQLPDETRRLTDKMVDTTSRHNQISIIHAHSAKKRGLAETAVSNQITRSG